jgi:methyl acetate hydrolase
MQRTMRALGLCLIVAITAAIHVPAQAPPEPVSRRNVDVVLADAVARHDVPGVVAMAVNRQGPLYQGAFGTADVSSGRPMTVDTLFRFYSMTKPITSVAAMQLVEQGKLSLDVPASTYLPELATIPVVTSFDASTGTYTVRPPARPITLRALLTHTAGFAYNFDSPIARDFKPRDGDSLREVLLSDPGEQWWYGTSTDWVGRIIERVSGQTLEGYFEQHIFRPLQMRNTYFNVPDDQQARIAAVHRRGDTGEFTAVPNRIQRTSVFSGGGGLISCAPDYARFVRMLLNGGTLDDVRVLKSETVTAMVTNQIGSLGAQALKTALPATSGDFSFVNDGRDKFGFGFLISVAPPAGRRSAGSVSWAGLANTWFWVDPARGVGGLFLSQMLPFADARVLAAADRFEQTLYSSLQR